MKRVYFGIDNGVTGTIGVLISDNGELASSEFFPIPTFKQQSYTKKKQSISRIDFQKLIELLSPFLAKAQSAIAVIERPYVNPTGIKATLSAIRALEAVLTALEYLAIPYEYTDSKAWQKALLPSGLKGPAELKAASADIGSRLFPQHAASIAKHKDADGLLIAEWARRNKK